MGIRDRIGKVRERIDWTNAFAGFLVSALLSPLIAPFVTSLVTPLFLGAGIFPTPDLQAEVQQTGAGYPEGATVERFDNITWESGYEVYRVRFSHNGGPTLSRAVFEVRFPGCIKNIQVPGSNRGYGAITINNPLKPQVEASNRPDSEVVGCTAQIVTENIHTHEGYTAEFVVDHIPSKCDMLTAYNPNREFFVEYEWQENGQKIERRLVGEIQNADEEFNNVTLPSNSTKLTQREDYAAYLYAVGNGNDRQAMNTCYGS